MSELTKYLYVLKYGEKEAEQVSLYSTKEECEEPNLKLEIDGAVAFAKLGEVGEDSASSLRIYQTSTEKTYAVLKNAEPPIIVPNYWVDLNGDIINVKMSEVRTINVDTAAASKNPYMANEQVVSVTFPSCRTIGNGEIVNGTAYGAFSINKNLAEVALDGVKTIGAYAFYNCTSLISTSCPMAISIGAYAFSNCSLLSDIVAAEVTSIGDYAFNKCVGLTSTSAFGSATYIGKYAFYQCSKLSAIVLPSAEEIGDSAFEVSASAYTVDDNQINEITLPNTIKIGYRAFLNRRLGLVNLPSVTEIGALAFSECSKNTTVDFVLNAPSVKIIGEGAFSNSHLKEITMPTVTKIAARAFKWTEADYGYLTKITISDVEEIGESAFYRQSITKVDCPKCTHVGQNCFFGCYALDEINLPSLTIVENGSIGGISGAFNGVAPRTLNLPNLIEIKDYGFSAKDATESTFTSTVEYEFPSLQVIGNYAFYRRPIGAVIATGVLSIGNYAFSASHLQSINYPNVITVGNRAFEKNNFTAAIFPMATSVGGYCFSSCKNLDTVVLASATTVGPGAFENCSALIDISLPKVIILRNGMFYKCTNLLNVSCSNVEEIEDNAFNGCDALLELSFPSAVTIADNAFAGCKRLGKIHFSGRNESVIKLLNGYPSNFGATNATVYFDLP